MVSLDSYEKATQWILELLELDPLVLVINAYHFNHMVLYYNKFILPTTNETMKLVDFQLVNMFDLMPNLSSLARTLPTEEAFLTTLVREYGSSWIPAFSKSYIEVLNMNALDYPDMEKWQKYRRTQISTNTQELLLLSLDSDFQIRKGAQARLKEIKC